MSTRSALLLDSNAIIRHLGRLAGLVGSSPDEEATTDMLLEQLMDLRNVICDLVYDETPQSFGPALEKAAVARFPAFLKGFDDFFRGDWLLGTQLSCADIVLYVGVYEHHPPLRAWHTPGVLSLLITCRCRTLT